MTPKAREKDDITVLESHQLGDFDLGEFAGLGEWWENFPFDEVT